jgi:hypothetical protein
LRSLPCVLAVALLALAGLLVAAGAQDVMLGILPLVVLVAALVRSPDLGTERLRRWVAARRTPRRRRLAGVGRPAAPARDRVRRGGLLVACSLAERGPPARLAPLAA